LVEVLLFYYRYVSIQQFQLEENFLVIDTINLVRSYAVDTIWRLRKSLKVSLGAKLPTLWSKYSGKFTPKRLPKSELRKSYW